MVIQHSYLADGARILKLEDGFLLDTEDYDVLAAYSHLHEAVRRMISIFWMEHAPHMSPSALLLVRIRPNL